MSHWPKWTNEEPPPHPFFLRAINDHVSLKEPGVWYAKKRVGVKMISKWLKMMIASLSGAHEGNYSNKSARVTTICRLNAMGVPPELGMRMTGHTSREGYMCYDVDSDGIIMRALQNVASAVPGSGGDVSWEAALKFEQDRFKRLQGFDIANATSSGNSHLVTMPSTNAAKEIFSQKLVGEAPVLLTTIPSQMSATTTNSVEAPVLLTAIPSQMSATTTNSVGGSNDQALVVHLNSNQLSHLSDEDFWEHNDVFNEVTNLMQNHGALAGPTYHVTNTRTVGSTIFHRNLTNYIIQITVPDASTAASMLSGSTAPKNSSK